MDQKVSVIIPTYNRADYIARAIESVLHGDYENVEVIVIDDGSTDNTEEIVSEYIERDSRIIYVKQENGGIGRARNTGLQKASGFFVTFLDSDDKFIHWRISKFVEYMNQNKDIDFCSSDIWIEFGHTKTKKSFRFLTKKPVSFFLTRIGSTFSGMNLFTRLDFVKSKIGFFSETINHWEDVDFIVRCFDNGLFGYISEPLLMYSVHGLNISKNQSVEEFIKFKEKVHPIYEKHNVGFFLWKSLGFILLQKGKKKSARKAFRKAIQSKPPMVDRCKIMILFIVSFLPL